MWTHKDTLRAARTVERILKEEARADEMLDLANFIRTMPLPEPPRFDCGCPPYGTCMNTACPRRVQVTCSKSGTDGVGWPD